ncbi:MAG TPA: hypothetical protein DIT17_09355, partial [Enterococcus faecalis]|nr:hypothetical protein [Enterococcus faecalis]
HKEAFRRFKFFLKQFHCYRKKALVLWHFSVTRPLLAVIISSVSRPCVLANHTTASRKHKGKMHEQARPC